MNFPFKTTFKPFRNATKPRDAYTHTHICVHANTAFELSSETVVTIASSRRLARGFLQQAHSHRVSTSTTELGAFFRRRSFTSFLSSSSSSSFERQEEQQERLNPSKRTKFHNNNNNASSSSVLSRRRNHSHSRSPGDLFRALERPTIEGLDQSNKGDFSFSEMVEGGASPTSPLMHHGKDYDLVVIGVVSGGLAAVT